MEVIRVFSLHTVDCVLSDTLRYRYGEVQESHLPSTRFALPLRLDYLFVLRELGEQ